MKYNYFLVTLVMLLLLISPVSALDFADCGDYPTEMLVLLAAIPIIVICVAIIILWHYATKSAESLFEKILNISAAFVIDVVIIGVALKLFFALTCHATF